MQAQEKEHAACVKLTARALRFFEVGRRVDMGAYASGQMLGESYIEKQALEASSSVHKTELVAKEDFSTFRQTLDCTKHSV